MKDKPWYKSKTVVAGIAIAVTGILQAYSIELPYEAVYSVLTGFGIYGVRDAISANKDK